MSDPENIIISKDDLDFLLDGNWAEFEYHTQHCFCVQCRNGYNSSITNYTISLNHLHDLVLKGSCTVCDHKMGRYIEFGVNKHFIDRSEALQSTMKIVKQIK